MQSRSWRVAEDRFGGGLFLADERRFLALGCVGLVASISISFAETVARWESRNKGSLTVEFFLYARLAFLSLRFRESSLHDKGNSDGNPRTVVGLRFVECLHQ